MGFIHRFIDYFRPGDEGTCVRNLGRNELCWCGSGNKYKKCHLEEDEKKIRSRYPADCGSA